MAESPLGLTYYDIASVYNKELFAEVALFCPNSTSGCWAAGHASFYY